MFATPDGLDGTKVVRHMYEHYGTVIAGARNRLKGKVLRIGTMGGCVETDICEDLLYLERTLMDLGWPVERGVAVDAAAKAIREA